jgi:hypothetical protein
MLDGILYCECGAPMVAIDGNYVCIASNPTDWRTLQAELDRVFPPKQHSLRPELDIDTQAILVQAFWVDIEDAPELSGWNVYVESAFDSVDEAFMECYALRDQPFALVPRFLIEVNGPQPSLSSLQAIAELRDDGVVYETVFGSLAEIEGPDAIVALLDERVAH